MGVKLEAGSTIGAFWPWGGPASPNPQAAKPTFLANPYVYNGLWTERMTDAIYAQVASAGFKGFRWQIHPGPWLEAMEAGDGARLAYLDGLIEAAADQCLSKGMAVSYTPFYTGYAGAVDTKPLQGLMSPDYLALKALHVHWAERFASRNSASFAAETFNEPPSPGRFPVSWEDVLQPDLYRAIRAKCGHTVIATCAEYSAPERFVDWDPTKSGFNDNVLYSFHPLRPAVVVLQGFIYNQYQYVQRLAYPPRPAEKQAQIDGVRARVNADTALSAAEKTATINGLIADLNTYFDTPQGYAWMLGVVEQIRAWAVRYGIPMNALHAGEYGMTRDNAGFPSIGVRGYLGGNRLDRVHIYQDWTRALMVLGCRRSPIHIDTNDYGVTFAQDDLMGAWDPLLLAAMAPKQLIYR